MKTYKVPGLNLQTPQEAKAKLVTALKAVHGVERATLNPSASEFRIEARPRDEPTEADIAAAASSAGFAVTES